MKTFYSLNQEKNNLIRKIEFEKKIQINDIKSVEDIKKEVSGKCIKEFGVHSWIKEKEKCMYGETYIYCSRCGKDKFSSILYDI